MKNQDEDRDDHFNKLEDEYATLLEGGHEKSAWAVHQEKISQITKFNFGEVIGEDEEDAALIRKLGIKLKEQGVALDGRARAMNYDSYSAKGSDDM